MNHGCAMCRVVLQLIEMIYRRVVVVSLFSVCIFASVIVVHLQSCSLFLQGLDYAGAVGIIVIRPVDSLSLAAIFFLSVGVLVPHAMVS